MKQWRNTARMDEKATAITIARMLIEVAARTNVAKQTTKAKQLLENKLRRLFAQQSIAYLKAFAKYQREFSKLTEALTSANIDTLFDTTAQSTRMAQAIQSAVENGVTLGANDLLTQMESVLSKEQIDIVFSLKNPRAVEYLKNYGVTRVSQLDTTSSEILRKLLTDGIDKGYSYSKLTTLIKKQFVEWSTKRAKLIAVTEMGNAYQQGNLIVGLDLKVAGLAMQKSWLTRGDDKVDPHCSANQDDGWIDVSKEHSSGTMVPLDHPGCRCVELYRRKPHE